jgi:NADPH:quinone reductase-like Zn-dependent oxidoreductase
MKSVRFYAHGGVDQLRFEDAPEPAAGPGEVVIRVHACALNYLDIWVRRGIPNMNFSFPHITGSDIAGVIEGIGAGVQHLSVGQRTVICPGLSCMRCRMCLSGKDNECAGYSVLGYVTDGGYAEYVKVPAANAFPYPDRLDFTSAAAVPLVFMTAWHMLVTRAAIKSGDDVLIIGAGSGVGSAAIQIAKFFHARTIATAGNESKLEKASALGADFTIDHTRQGIRTEVKRITGGRGVDVVFEHVGVATWAESISSLAPGGRLVTCGATTGHQAALDIRHLFAKQITVLGSYMGTKGELMEILNVVQHGHLNPVVSDVYPLKDAAGAQSLLEGRTHFGKIVLVI